MNLAKKLGDASMVVNDFADAKGLKSVNERSLNYNWSAVHPVRVILHTRQKLNLVRSLSAFSPNFPFSEYT
jgi:hypothetical protein